MDYPTLEQVNEASRTQLCSWWRFLPSPGMWAVGKGPAIFDKALVEEVKVMDRIAERMKEVGGFTPEISKLIGWQ